MMNNKKPIIIISIVVACILSFCLKTCGHDDKIKIEANVNVPPDSLPSPNLNVFLENSGSMDGYMADGSTLKDAVYSYVSDLKPICDTIRLAYINSKVIDCNVNLENYIKNLTPQSFASAGGFRGNSDISQVISDVLANTDNNDVSLLISDFILDLPKKDPTKFLGFVSTSIRNALVDKIKQNPNFGVLILYMESTFTGRYFYPTGSEMLNNATRPYYIWIFGDQRFLCQIMEKTSFTEIKYGYKDYAAYCNAPQLNYKAMNITWSNSYITKRNGNYSFLIDVDFSPTLQPKAVVEDIANYEVSPNDLKLTEIKSVIKSESPYTNTLYFSLPEKNVGNMTTTVKFTPPTMPAWIDKVNTESTDSITAHLDQTTGMKSLVQGVADAYKKDKTTVTFTIKFKQR